MEPNHLGQRAGEARGMDPLLAADGSGCRSAGRGAVGCTGIALAAGGATPGSAHYTRPDQIPVQSLPAHPGGDDRAPRRPARVALGAVSRPVRTTLPWRRARPGPAARLLAVAGPGPRLASSPARRVRSSRVPHWRGTQPARSPGGQAPAGRPRARPAPRPQVARRRGSPTFPYIDLPDGRPYRPNREGGPWGPTARFS